MTAQSMLNAKYERLCQLLGDLEYKKFAIEEQIKNVRQEITTLNTLVPEMVKVEKVIAQKAELANKAGTANELANRVGV